MLESNIYGWKHARSKKSFSIFLSIFRNGYEYKFDIILTQIKIFESVSKYKGFQVFPKSNYFKFDQVCIKK